jgi:hypothetical protein
VLVNPEMWHTGMDPGAGVRFPAANQDPVWLFRRFAPVQGCLLAAGPPCCQLQSWMESQQAEACGSASSGCSFASLRHIGKSTACGCRPELAARGCGMRLVQPGMQPRTPHLVARVRRDGAMPGGFQRPTSDTVCGRFRNGPSSAAREEAVLFPRDPTEDLDSVGGAGKAESSRLVAEVDQRSWSSCVIVSNYPSQREDHQW